MFCEVPRTNYLHIANRWRWGNHLQRPRALALFQKSNQFSCLMGLEPIEGRFCLTLRYSATDMLYIFRAINFHRVLDSVPRSRTSIYRYNICRYGVSSHFTTPYGCEERGQFVFFVTMCSNKYRTLLNSPSLSSPGQLGLEVVIWPHSNSSSSTSSMGHGKGEM